MRELEVGMSSAPQDAALRDKLRGLSPARRAALEKLLREKQAAAGVADGASPIPLQPRDGTLPLSFDQERLWFLQQIDPEQASLVLQGRVRSAAPAPVIEAAFAALVERHEILRTTYAMGPQGPVQLIHPPTPVQLPLIDLGAVAEAEATARMQALIQEQRDRPFDLDAGPVWRALLVRYRGLHYLCLTIHHIATDGWSLGRLSSELTTCIGAIAAGRAPALPAPPLQYADFAAWQRRSMQGAMLEARLAYWRERLDGMPAALDLPTDHPRPVVLGGRGARVCVLLPASSTAALRRLAEGRSATLFMVLMALFKTFLFRYTGQTDLVVGTPVAGRDRPELEEVQGVFVNALVLRTRFAAETTFEGLVERVRETVLGAFEHRDLPFEKLVEALQPPRDLSRNPLYQALLSKPLVGELGEMGGDQSPAFQGLTHLAEGQSDFDLALWVEEYAESLGLIFHYNPDLFLPATVERMARHFLRLAEAVADDPARSLWALPMLTPEDLADLDAGNRTGIDLPFSPLTRRFEQQVRRAPRATALVSGGERLDYRSLNAGANRLARYLRALGVGPEVKVAIALERGPTMVVALLAVLKAGGAYVPIDPALPAARREFMLRDSAAELLLADASVEAPAEGGIRIIDPAAVAEALSALADSDLETAAAPADLAYLIYTSGSTGVPKGVQITHGNLDNFLLGMRQHLEVGPQDALLAVTTLSFDIAGLELYLPLIAGAQVRLADRREAADGLALDDLLDSGGVTLMQATPATWRLLLDSGWRGRPELRALCGGEALPRELAEALLSRCGEVWNLYGPTETTVWSTLVRVESGNGPVPIGRPLANTRIHILDGHAQPVPVGVAGELYIGGAGVARGYWQRPELNDTRFLTDPFAGKADARLYRTGDRARFRPDGQIEYLGRLDDQVKLRGYRIELGEIETLLARLPGIRQAAVLVREDRPGDQRLVAYLVAAGSEAPDTESIREQLGGQLPGYMVPSTCVFLDALPLTPNGKLDRKALPVPGGRQDAAHLPPRSPAERALAAVWAEVLGVERVGVHDNFFDLGGHSLLAMQAIVRLREQHGLSLDPRNFYQQSLGQLAAGLDGGSSPVAAELPGLRLHPFLFGTPPHRLFGLLRQPVGVAATIGVLLCAPHAYEYIRCHRALRELGQRLARNGCAVLSFDYRGSGDSAGDFAEATTGAWQEDVRSAIGALREGAGVDRVVVVGWRLGASLALAALADDPTVAGLVLWDPIVRGEELRGELAAIRAAQRQPASRVRELEAPDLLSFPLTAALEAELLAIDLPALAGRRRMAPLLLLCTAAAGDAPALVDGLRSGGTEVELRVVDEARVWLREPHESVVPQRALAAILEWTQELCR